MGPHRYDWIDKTLISFLGVLLAAVFGMLLAIRANDVAKIQWLIDQNTAQEARISTVEARQQTVFHELDRARDRLERLEARTK